MIEHLIKIDALNETAVKGMFAEWSKSENIFPERFTKAPLDDFRGYCSFINSGSVGHGMGRVSDLFVYNGNTHAVVGLVEIWECDSPMGNISIGVRPTHRHFGLGATVLQLALAYWWERFNQPPTCNVKPTNEYAIKLLAKFNAVRLGTVTVNSEVFDRYYIPAPEGGS